MTYAKRKKAQNVHQSIQTSKFRASTTDNCLEVSMFVARGFQFTVKSNSGWVWFCFNFPYVKTHVTLSTNQMQNENQYQLDHLRFSRVSLAPCHISLCSDWLL